MRFDPVCKRCPRLAAFLDKQRAEHPQYHNAPVASFGDPEARLLVVGLAPGMHGANATGRPFTGDYAGILLYRTLFAAGLANQPSVRGRDDGLELTGCRITNAVKCLPPENKPTTAEVDTCNVYLRAELEQLPRPAVVLALGTIAHRAVLKAQEERASRYPFGHGREHRLAFGTMIDSYHCSRYNTQTGRLTSEMFELVVSRAAALACGVS